MRFYNLKLDIKKYMLKNAKSRKILYYASESYAFLNMVPLQDPIFGLFYNFLRKFIV